jgi:CHAT domain-containing protein
VHVGTDATETSVKALSGKAPSILHISTHGFYFSEKQAKKKDYLHFMGFEGQNNVNEEDKALSRSGLLMAGANRSLEGEDIPMNDDDGILTAQEISLLDLRGTDLVVLSACETGRGDIMQGEGVFGLQRGFKKAGVKTILMSQWKVSDIATEMLMTEFYRNYCNGESKRESLRLAQKKVREFKDDEGNYLFKDPHYWAAFIVLD